MTGDGGSVEKERRWDEEGCGTVGREASLTRTLMTAVAPHAERPICVTCRVKASISVQIITFSEGSQPNCR